MKYSLISILLLITISLILNCGCTTFSLEDIQKTSKDVDIINVTITPENPKAGDNIFIKFYTQNCSNCQIIYLSNYDGNGESMKEISNNVYSFSLGPIENNSLIWFIIYGKGDQNNFFVSEDYEIIIGNLNKNDDLKPNIEKSSISEIEMTIDLSILNNISSVELKYINLHSDTQGGGIKEMYVSEKNIYNTSLNSEDFGLNLSSGTSFYYRVVIKDYDGNLFTTSTFKYTL